MNEHDEPGEFTPRPKPAMVIGLLCGVAVVVSYLLAYCMYNALVAADVIGKWQPGADPRLKWFAVCFITQMVVFGGGALCVRSLSNRHLQRIDSMDAD